MENKKEIINVTDLTAWLYCPRMFYLRKVKNIKTPATKEMIAGKIKHEILESFSKKEDNLVKKLDRDYDKVELSIIYSDFLKEISELVLFKNRNLVDSFHLNKEEIIKKVLRDFSQDLRIRIESIKSKLKLGLFKEDLWNNLDSIYISELKLESEYFGLRGRIDRVEIIKSTNEVIPYEVKNREEKIFYSDQIQLTAYAMLLEDHYKTTIKKGFIESGIKKEPLEIAQEDRESVVKLAEEIRNMSTNSPPPMQSNFNKCRKCSLNEVCPSI